MRAHLALLLTLAVPSAWASDSLEHAVARLQSPNRSVRQKAVVDFLKGFDALTRESRFDPTLLPKVTRYLALRNCGPKLTTAVDIAEGSPGEARVGILMLAKSVGSPDFTPSKEPTYEFLCGNVDSDYVERLNALNYVVSRRPNVVRNLLADPKIKCRGRLLDALLKLGHEGDQAIVIRLLKAEPLSLRMKAVAALADRPKGPALDLALEAARSPSAHLRNQAAIALRAWSDTRAQQALESLLEDENEVVRGSAMFSLREFRSAIAVSVLVDQLSGPSSKRGQAVFELPFHPAASSIPELVRRAYAGEEDLFDALSAIDHPSAREAMLYLSEDYRGKSRAAALMAMRLAKGPEIERRLILALRDSSPEVVSAALFAISHQRLKAAVPVLRAMRKYGVGQGYKVENALRNCLGLGFDDPLPED